MAGAPIDLAVLQQLIASGRSAEALATISALPLAGQAPDLAYLHALAASHCAQRDRAEAALEQCLKAAPSHPGALFQRAALALADGRLAAALDDLQAVVRAAPGWAAAHYNLGLVQAKLGQPQRAERSYREALRLQPRLSQAANNLGNLLCDRGAPMEAVTLLEDALRADPAFAVGWSTLGRALLRARRLPAAEAALRRSIGLDDSEAAAWQNLGEVLQAMDRPQQAMQAYDRALALQPQAEGLAFKLATLRGAQPSRPPDVYVRELFDGMAESFDHWLVETLGYRLPLELGRYLPSAAGLDVLDLGCGTGLAAAALRPLARRLEGVDLSTHMLQKAAARGLYDALHASSLQDQLECADAAWDLLLAADVFIYVGALEGVFEAASKALRRGGRLLFSVELPASRAEAGYVLQHTGRYAHAREYLHALAARSGLEVELDEDLGLRREQAQMLPGAVMRLRRP